MSWLPVSRCYFGTAYASRYQQRRRRFALSGLALIGVTAAWVIYRAAFGWPL